MRFSQRQGHLPIKSALQIDSIDLALKNALWNTLQVIIWDSHKNTASYYTKATKYSNLYKLLSSYWADFFKQPLDSIPYEIQDAIQSIRDFFFSCKWYEIYDFIEFSAGQLTTNRARFIEACNTALEREVSGFRFIGNEISPITSEEEIGAIEQAVGDSRLNNGAKQHLHRALELLSDRSAPDYRNSIKESISAVESLAQQVTDDPSATLGSALKAIDKKLLHPALNKSLTALYGYTSDAEGIRHALLDEAHLDFTDAKFMLVSCSAFVNYLIGKKYP
jgi:hypothetical protein